MFTTRSKQIIALICGSVIGLVSISSITVYRILSRMYNDIKPTNPTKEMLKSEESNMHNNALFKLFPSLKTKIAWISLGDYPSVIDKLHIQLPKSGKRICISLKREDLVSKSYGGNKVRTLEYQLACAKIHLNRINEQNKSAKHKARMVSIGGSASNQIVAASVHANKHNIPLLQYPADGEGESFDNGLNFISAMSFPDYFSKPFFSLSKVDKLRYFYHTLNGNHNNLFSMPGGANVTGVLGHINAILELVEQIKNGQCMAPKHIFLALGSSCTTSGLTAGLALIRKLGIGKCLNDTQLHAIGVHHELHSKVGRKVVMFAIRKLSHDALELIHNLGGPNAIDELENVYERIQFDTNFAGQYGAWTAEGLLAKQIVINGELEPADHPKPWLCSCFSSKSFAAMINFLEHEIKTNGKNVDVGKCMFWCTKSIVQPMLNKDAAKSNFEKVNEEYAEVNEWLKGCYINQESDYLTIMSKL